MIRLPLGRAAQGAAPLDAVIAAATSVVLGKEHQIRLALACLLARGHLLIEDVPGVGKTTLAHTLASALGLRFQRIQFTSDLLPADILGVSIFERDRGAFSFRPGPVFANVVLADEVNRATPRTQSALLEAMEENQVTVEGETHRLPLPFFVIATQNPSHQVGTFPLPESQLDRFMMRLALGYPDLQSERELLRGQDRRELLAALQPAIDAETLAMLQSRVPNVHVSEALLDYLQQLVEYSRSASQLVMGLSPRAGRAVLRCAQAWAMIHGRPQVVPEDVQAVLANVVVHRLQPVDATATPPERLAELLLRAVPVP